MHSTFSRDHIASSCKHARSFVQWKRTVGLLVLALMLSMGSDTLPTAHAQYGWSNDAPPENPWQIEQPEEDEADDDPWGTNDPWGTEDAWGGNNSWNEDEAYRDGRSDWARDFYDFDDGNSSGDKGSAERVGDGVAMSAVTCTSDSDCTGRGNPRCCISEDGTTTACSRGQSCNSGDAGGIPGGSQPIEDPNAPEPVPIPGIAYLLALGLAFGAYKLT